LNLEIETTFYSSNNDAHISTQDDYLITFLRSSIKVDFSSELSEEDYFAGVINLKEVGYISAYRVNLDYDPTSLAILADLTSSNLCFACSFFFYNEKDHLNHLLLSSQYIYYIEEVFIKPEFRGLGFGIQGLAMFLLNFASHETVCCHPHPIFDLEEKYSEKQGKFLMRKYWSKIGLEYYAEDENILWTDNWCIPKWLKHQIFSSN
jgi:hypothetical protein